MPFPAAGASGQTRRAFARRLALAATLALIVSTATAARQRDVPDRDEIETALASTAAEQAEVGQPATLMFANRPIVQLRGSLLGRAPDERVAAGHLTLERLVDAGITGPVTTRAIGSVVSLEVAGRRIVAILPADVDALAGETPASVAVAAVPRLETALNEVGELRRPWQLLSAVIQVLVVSVLFIGIIVVLRKAHRRASAQIAEVAERRIRATKVGNEELLRSSRIIELVKRSISALTWTLGLFLAYSWLTFGLRRFPYTRPWGESLRAFLLGQLSQIGLAILQALPGLFTVLLIALVARFVIRILHLLFHAIEEERIEIPWMYPEIAQPTRKIMTVGLWLFAAVLAYPYLPGSGSDAFKGMSVFIGLVVSLGSSGIVNQVMSGFTLTFSRALRVGDFVAVGDVEGTVTQVGTLSTKIRTARVEDVTIPNAVIVSQTVTNYSRFAESHGVFVPTEITIGYDVPWRQVEALLLLAAARTPGVRREPAPVVRQSALEDAYIRYTLLFCPEAPALRRVTLAAVHTNILDAFNEYGVQITSPVYEADPESPKVVPREQWFAAPARTASAAAAPSAAVDRREIKA